MVWILEMCSAKGEEKLESNYVSQPTEILKKNFLGSPWEGAKPLNVQVQEAFSSIRASY